MRVDVTVYESKIGFKALTMANCRKEGFVTLRLVAGEDGSVPDSVEVSIDELRKALSAIKAGQ